jgi:hypothetical protein
MKETRAGKYGRNLAIWINHTIEEMPEGKREDYRARFLTELKTYSFRPRKNGQPCNEGCVHELSDLAEIEISNPEHLAMLVKEGVHLMYQKETSARVFEALKKYL